MSGAPRVVVSEDVGAAAGERLAQAIGRTVRALGRCRLAIPGGTGAVPVLEWLAAHLPPALVPALVVTWVDERHLPPLPEAQRLVDDGDWRSLPVDTNLRLGWEHWLSRVPSPPRLLPMLRPGSVHDAAREHARAFAAELGGLDVVLLGVGPDGHVASLFPEDPALHAPGTCAAVTDAPKPPPERLTLTLSVLEEVEHAVLVVTGAAKAPVLRRALAGDASIPLGRYRPRGEYTWVLDPAAAADIQPS